MRASRAAWLFCALSMVVLGPAAAGPWAEVGDAQTRSDLEQAAAAGLVDNVTMQWPIPWTGILGSLQSQNQIDALPDGVREAAERLRDKGTAALDLYRAHASLTVDATNDPATVRGFDALSRDKVQGYATYEHLWKSTAIHLEVGAQYNNRGDGQTLVLDNSYIAQRVGGLVVYAGYVPHWWGPGWISALQLSNNARPMPQVGFSRVHTEQSDSWLLSWLGPWQIEGFVGLLDGPRTAHDTAFVALRVAFNPAPGLEIGLSRTTEMCGSGHPCSPLVDYFTFTNDSSHANRTNDQGSIDIRYTNMLFSRPFAVYAQVMNEDSNPIVNSATSHLFGATVWLPVEGLTGRLTLEYANSIATKNIWGDGVQHGAAYNNYQYSNTVNGDTIEYWDGMRYRGRSLGFSLDSDSILYSAQASIVDSERRTYTLTYHRALVSTLQNPDISNPLKPTSNSGNPVTTEPVRFNALEARFTVPLEWNEYRVRIDAAARWQDDQPRPDHGMQAAFELSLGFGI